MKHFIPMKYGDEYDSFTAWKKYLHWCAGERKRIKKMYRKRERRYLKRLRDEPDSYKFDV